VREDHRVALLAQTVDLGTQIEPVRLAVWTVIASFSSLGFVLVR
jgi:hypothetical protein